MAVWVSVEQVDVTIDATLEPVTTNLTKGQDETKCVPFYSQYNLAPITDQHQDHLAEVEIIDNAGTAAVRVSASARADNDDTVFRIFIIEFAASINVQQIAVTFDPASVNVAITDVGSQADAFLLYSYQHTNPSSSDDDWDAGAVQCRFNGAATNSVTLSRRDGTGNMNGTLYVVDCDSAEWIVDHREIDVTTATDVVGTDTISATVEADTFLIHSYETSEISDDLRDGAWQADLQNTTTVRVRRTIAATPDATSTHSIAVVECQNNEWDVQRNDVLTLNAVATTDSITAIDQTRSFIIPQHCYGFISCGRDDETNGARIDDNMYGADFSADDTVRFTKKGTDSTDDIVSYEVIQFAEAVAGIPPRSQVALQAVSRMGYL